MLLVRTFTAIILGASTIGVILCLPIWLAKTIFAVVLLLGAIEWVSLAGVRSRVLRSLYGLATICIAVLLHDLLRDYAGELALLIIACMWWMMAGMILVHYQIKGNPGFANGFGLASLGALIFIFCWVALNVLFEHDRNMLIALFAMVWCADTFAYLGGKTFGRRRLASRISPGKTWEGFVAGVCGTGVLAILIAWVFGFWPLPIITLVVFTTLISSVIGDLFESLAKRYGGVKDSGSLLPGHGGVLDRIDSTLAAAPVFALGIVSAGTQ